MIAIHEGGMPMVEASVLHLLKRVLKELPEDVDDATARSVMQVWNMSIDPPIPTCSRLTAKLIGKIKSRMKEHKVLGIFEMAFVEVANTPYCRGESTDAKFKGWTADLMWTVEDGSRFQRIVDRAQGRKRTVASHASSSRPSNCRHTPACTSALHCTDKRLSEVNGEIGAAVRAKR